MSAATVARGDWARARMGDVSSPRRGSATGRPYRRLRRWARHTPNGEIALAMMAVGLVLVLAAALIAAVAL